MTALCHGVTFHPVPTMTAVAAPVLFTENVCWVLGAGMSWADSKEKHKCPLLSEGSKLSTHRRLPLGPGPPSLSHFFLFLSPTSGLADTAVLPLLQEAEAFSSSLPSPLRSVIHSRPELVRRQCTRERAAGPQSGAGPLCSFSQNCLCCVCLFPPHPLTLILACSHLQPSGNMCL